MSILNILMHFSYNPAERPWLAMIIVGGGVCGGALVNHRYIVFVMYVRNK